MRITIEITDEKQIQQLETLRGDKTLEEIAVICVEHGLQFIESRRRQQQAAEEAGKHPLLQFPEAKPEMRDTEAAAIEAALKAKNPQDPIAIEINRLVTTYIAQMNLYAAQNGGRMPPAVQVKVEAPIQRAALQIALAALKNANQQRGAIKAAA